MIDFSQQFTAEQLELARRLLRNSTCRRGVASRTKLPLHVVAALARQAKVPKIMRAARPRAVKLDIGDRINSIHGVGYLIGRLPDGLCEIGLEASGEICCVLESRIAFEPTEEEIYERLAPAARKALENPTIAAKRAVLGRTEWDVPEWPGMRDKELGGRE